jgi:hypothetical protein
MDRNWQYAYIVIPLVIVLGAIWFLRSRPDESAIVDRCTSAPAAPTELTFALVQNTPGQPARVTLTWKPSSAGDPATIYVVEAGSTSGATNVGNFISNIDSYATDAPPGSYYARVRAQNACGSSDPSNEVLVTIQ